MICSGGKVRERPEGENCESNFSESPSNYVAKQVLGNEVSVKKLVELLEATTVAARLFLFNGNLVVVGKIGSDPKGKIAKAILANLRATMLRSKF